ncbi:GrpE-domain-containing protein [Lasiosphaeria miniovina]|uniref:GrpE protein homolog n=1 Tax=Lasiosphaeria miniovina TaxID=1954250 RepID=A0AA39ZZA1_9PEZI|nr:GrpE-domain-containing protein [Lasiosphaeria miniovina]KAK0706411.1 GrpE-domain-containing protein [Lasiosphaeria miniovina]
MLRQTLSTPSRAIGSSLRLAAQRPVARPQFYRAPLAATRSVAPIALQRARWYSSEAEPSKDADVKDASKAEESAKSETDSVESTLRKQLEAKDVEARDWKDKFLRSVADFRNLQERTARDMKAARDFAIQKFAKDLVDSVDNFDRALAMVPEDKLKAEEQTEQLRDLVNLYEGLRMTESILLETLKKHGLERFDPHGEKFNPNEHEATFMTPMADKDENTVIHTQQKGFRLNGRILRPAKVGVVKNK